MIMECTCKHKFQDELYGKGQRVFNDTKDGYRCTVCHREVKTGGSPKKAEAKSGGKK